MLKIVVDGTQDAAPRTTSSRSTPSTSHRRQPTAARLHRPPQPGTGITLNGRESKIIVADYNLGGNQLQYSTSEIMTNATIAGRDVAVLYGDHGSDGETVLNYPVKPTVQTPAARSPPPGTRSPATCG